MTTYGDPNVMTFTQLAGAIHTRWHPKRRHGTLGFSGEPAQKLARTSVMVEWLT